ncbi:AraC family transcriptional regulator [Pedobacter jamesrossensis]|uniref:Helix-turn-helix domain-containing protein n=1 Tax=Pedobacter jamesrossensis TaxID=1908238 RepID=A0ABV8NIL0_9SPHI
MMIFEGPSHEKLTLEIINSENKQTLFDVKSTDMTIIWNTGKSMTVDIDRMGFHLSQNQIIFLTDYQKIDCIEVDSARLIRFNQPFFCPVNYDNEVGSKGLLFFGAMEVPIVEILPDDVKKFETLWEIFSSEMHDRDSLQMDMLQSLLKRMLILSARNLKKSSRFHSLQKNQIDIIREFSFLVEGNFSTHHDVAFYASKLNKSPKTLSNLFALASARPPLEIIHDRIMLHARRQLNFTRLSVKEIAYSLGYEDLQTFSRFFKNREGISPIQYRERIAQLVVA